MNKNAWWLQNEDLAALGGKLPLTRKRFWWLLCRRLGLFVLGTTCVVRSDISTLLKMAYTIASGAGSCLQDGRKLGLLVSSSPVRCPGPLGRAKWKHNASPQNARCLLLVRAGDLKGTPQLLNTELT